MQGIVVFCASSSDIPETYIEAARMLGIEIANAGVPLINGGGHAGLMGVTTDAALAMGGEVIGILPQFMVDAGLNHHALTRTIITSGMHSRKEFMAEASFAAIALPGGLGTLDELADIMTMRKLGLYSGPVIILNTNGFYDSLLAWLQASVEQGFTSLASRPYMVASTPTEAVAMAMQSRADTLHTI